MSRFGYSDKLYHAILITRREYCQTTQNLLRFLPFFPSAFRSFLLLFFFFLFLLRLLSFPVVAFVLSFPPSSSSRAGAAEDGLLCNGNVPSELRFCNSKSDRSLRTPDL
mmetsp:Transcript_18137/g.31880  ORF Transcript_18137/g.31880 Transcript_18137/m.31880 type:complete len:109 (-) Transcript_18137:937-1263(-)